MKSKLSFAIRIFIGLVFIVSAYTKLIAPGIVEIILVDHGIAASREIAAVYVRILIGLEFALGLLFFQPYYLKKIVIPSSLFFLIGFSIYLFYTGYILGDTQNCGCFGTAVEMSPLESIIKNIVLIILAVLLYKILSPDKKNFLVPSAILLIMLVSTFIYSPIRSVKDFKFAEYTDFEEKGRVDLSGGDKLLALLNTECDHCQALTKELVKLKGLNDNFPELYALVFTEGDVSIDSFKVLTGFDFPYHMINAKTFFDLIGTSPPRIYWLQNGEVKEYWDKAIIKDLSDSFQLRKKG